MQLTGWIAAIALLLTALGMFIRNTLTVLRADRQVRELAEKLKATVQNEQGRDVLVWWQQKSRYELSLYRTRTGKLTQIKLTLKDESERPECKLTRRPSETQLAPGAVDTGPYALGHRRFDQIGRVIGITNFGVKEHLTAGDREDVAARLLRDGFIEVEMTGNNIAAERADALRADDLTLERVADWARKLAQL
ncbi:MAG TPA: hypothetical protein PKW95_15290 [bacterium]|nr:hypothetical protein [bacterium]